MGASNPTMDLGIVHPLAFLPFHIALSWLSFRVYPTSLHLPLMAFGGVQYVVEHYADKFPQVAAAGPILVPIAVGLLAYHYRLVWVSSSGSKTHVWIGLVGYILTLGISKGMELGFPKGTGDEQIAALKDPTYNFQHLVLHVVLCVVMYITGMSVPAGGKVSIAD